MNGVGEVRAIAKVYGELATGGSALGLARATLDELEAVVTPSFDEIFRLDSTFTMGFMKPFPILPFGSTPKAYGHTGLGGSFGFADPDAGLGYAYTMNRGGYSLPTDPTRNRTPRRGVPEYIAPSDRRSQGRATVSECQVTSS